MQRVDGVVDRQVFEYLLRNIRFTFDPSCPNVQQYYSFVDVVAYDGVYTSTVATTHISVNVINQPPRVLFNDESTVTLTVRDGEAMIPLFPTGATITIIEDSSELYSVSITLTSPRHPQERLSIDEATLPASISAVTSTDGSSITLSGLTSPAEYIEVLTSPYILYHYPPIGSILQGEVPDLAQR